ncbi:hypothetical protein N7451_005482 [Penicillium sp. IBT 35674x]|nr:hypothetical protein N7451_005482 [Penicillium sp. IBT 35674x]
MQRIRNRLQRPPAAAASPTVENENQDPTSEQLGMHVLKDKPSDANGIVDIVALHGLNGHPTKTWTVHVKETSVNWLKDMLPTAIENARIMSYGYDSSVQFSKSTADIGTFAEGLLAELISRRMEEKEKGRPIIFICHSLGGIVFKQITYQLAKLGYFDQALVKARERDRFADLLKKIRGVAFFGTPHAGSSLATFGEILASIIRISSIGTNTNATVVANLKNNSETLWQIARSFVDRGKGLRIVTFYETEKMPYMNRLIVEENSAILNLPNEVSVPINGDHTSICRFSNRREDENRYRLVSVHLKEMVDEISKSEVSYFTKLSPEDQRRCLRCLYFNNYESFRDRNPDRVVGTCNWFLQHREYQKWRTQARSSLLWVSADPGYGKSVLAKFLVEHLRHTKSDDGRPEFVCHFFFKGDNDEQRKTVLALRALLHQIFKNDPALLRHAFSSFESKDTAMVDDLDTLWDILVAVVSDQEATNLLCILDGLDELELRSQRDLLERLNKLYNKKNLLARPFVKIIVLSRPENLIKTCFTHNVATVRLRGENETEAISKDVEYVVRSHMDDLKAQGLPQDLLTKVQQVLIHKADRTFLWTTLIINLLKDAAMDGASENEIKELLSSRDIDNVYAVLLSRSTSQTRTKKLLQLVLGARQPLTLRELNVALAVSPRHPSFRKLGSELKMPMENYIKATCGHFVRIIHERVYLVHQTAREFLLQQNEDIKKPLGPWYRSLNQVECDNVLLRSCISYMFLYTVADDEVHGMPVSDLIFPYASKHWPLHCQNNNLDIFQEILDVSLHMHDRWPEYTYGWSFAHKLILRWDNWRFAGADSEGGWKNLGARATSALDANIQTLLCDGRVCVQAHNCVGRTLLHYAVAGGSFNLVRALLRKGASIAALDGYLNSPLHLAAVSQILEDDSGVYRAQTMFYTRPVAETLRIIDYLIAQGADIEAHGHKGRTPLMQATQLGNVGFVDVLCSHGANVNATDDDGMTAVFFAVKQGSVELVKYLIDHGADVNWTCHNCLTPLLLASQQRLTAIAEVLITHGAESRVGKIASYRAGKESRSRSSRFGSMYSTSLPSEEYFSYM